MSKDLGGQSKNPLEEQYHIPPLNKPVVTDKTPGQAITGNPAQNRPTLAEKDKAKLERYGDIVLLDGRTHEKPWPDPSVIPTAEGEPHPSAAILWSKEEIHHMIGQVLATHIEAHHAEKLCPKDCEECPAEPIIADISSRLRKIESQNDPNPKWFDVTGPNGYKAVWTKNDFITMLQKMTKTEPDKKEPPDPAPTIEQELEAGLYENECGTWYVRKHGGGQPCTRIYLPDKEWDALYESRNYPEHDPIRFHDIPVYCGGPDIYYCTD